jgi:hypothetical protein
MRVAEPGFHEKVFGLYGQGHRDCETVGRICFGEVKGLDECCGGEDGFLPGERAANATSRAISLEWKERLGAVLSLCVIKRLSWSGAYEWLPGIVWQRVEGFFVHALRAESLDVLAVHLL